MTSRPIQPGAEPFAFGEGGHAVLFLHGWTSTAREMRFLAEAVAARNFHCRGLLLKGHGTAVEDLHGVRFADHLAECGRAFDELAAKHERVSICGLSVGALLALHTALRKPCANLVLFAPFVRVAGRSLGISNQWLVDWIPYFGDIPKGNHHPIDDPEAQKRHLTYDAMPSKGLASILRACRDLLGRETDIRCPTLIFHAVHDRTSDLAGSFSLMRTLGSQDKTLVALNRGNHVITLDYDRAFLETQTVEWLCRHR